MQAFLRKTCTSPAAAPAWFGVSGPTVTVGYQPCADGSLEAGVEKTALYALKSGVARHAALQQPDGAWVSKLGPDEDTEHTLPGLEGPCYGHVVAFLGRARTAP